MTLEQAMIDYRKKFGKNYPLLRTSTASTERVIQDIQYCIQENRPAETHKNCPKDHLY